MNRRELNKKVLAGLMATGLGVVSSDVLAGIDECKVNFTSINPVILDKQIKGIVKLDPMKNNIIEFFWYGCSHCNDLQPYMNEWIEKDRGTSVIRIPAVFNAQWEVGARLFYALHETGLFSEEIHAAIFNAVHKEKTLDIGKVSGIQAFLVSQKFGFTEVNKVIGVMTSDRTNKRIAAAKSAANEYKLIGTPTLVVENKYLVSATEAGSTAKVVEATKKVMLDIKACR